MEGGETKETRETKRRFALMVIWPCLRVAGSIFSNAMFQTRAEYGNNLPFKSQYALYAITDLQSRWKVLGVDKRGVRRRGKCV